MIVFDEKQIKDLKGQYSAIARSCGVTLEYVRLLLAGKRQQKSEKSQEVLKKAKAILEILNN